MWYANLTRYATATCNSYGVAFVLKCGKVPPYGYGTKFRYALGSVEFRVFKGGGQIQSREGLCTGTKGKINPRCVSVRGCGRAQPYLRGGGKAPPQDCLDSTLALGLYKFSILNQFLVRQHCFAKLHFFERLRILTSTFMNRGLLESVSYAWISRVTGCETTRVGLCIFIIVIIISYCITIHFWPTLVNLRLTFRIPNSTSLWSLLLLILRNPWWNGVVQGLLVQVSLLPKSPSLSKIPNYATKCKYALFSIEAYFDAHISLAQSQLFNIEFSVEVTIK